MSERGTFETCSLALTTSVYWGRPEVARNDQSDAIDPLRS